MDTLLLILDEAISAIVGEPSAHRIARWNRWIERDNWTQDEIDRHCPIITPPTNPPAPTLGRE
jgi:hypothetical protein